MAGRRALAAAGARDEAANVATLRREPSQARSRERLALVLDAAATLVDELGPEAVTTTMIAERAGASVGWLYDFFVDREAIYNAVIVRAMDRLDIAVAEARAAHPRASWTTLISITIDALVEFYRSEPGYRALWFSPFLSIEMVEAMRTHDAALSPQAVTDLAELGIELVGVDPQTALHLAIGIIDKGLDLAFRFDLNGDAAMIEETKRAVIGYTRPYVRRVAKARP